jgi:hypothetical protein
MRLAILLALAGCSPAHGESTPTGPVILELFTSQGCSSCPPADKLLGKLTTDKQLVGLSFHVDYWNDLGWKDPYSTAAWTRRQHAYAAALGDDRVYTPELVVGGTVGMVGSNVAAISNAIAKAERPALLAAKPVWSKDTLELTTTAPANADVYVAVFESARTNKVPRGENSGTTSAHKNVVRRFERVAAAGKAGTITVPLDTAWTDVGAVVFAQRADKKIVASASVPRM